MKKYISAVLIGTMLSTSALAYYQKTDYTEIQEILPNQSAFLIPEVGDNKAAQGQFGSVDYLSANKVAMKRVTIPHVKLSGSGTFIDYFVPAARLVIVDRTPYHREWAAGAKGTSAKDESFSFESAESLNISADITISAYVTEEDAAKFLYWFGTKPLAGDPTQPETMFTSIIYSKSLTEVMDTVVRGAVQADLAKEFGKRTLDDAIHHKSDIMDAIQKDIVSQFASQGITIKYIGYASSLTYDPKVQEAINEVFMATEKNLATTALSNSIPVLQAQADIQVKEGLAEGLKKGFPALPTFLFTDSKIFDTISNLLSPNTKQVSPSSK